MANVYIEPRPKDRHEAPIDHYAVEDHAGHELKTFKTQEEAINGRWVRATTRSLPGCAI